MSSVVVPSTYGLEMLCSGRCGSRGLCGEIGGLPMAEVPEEEATGGGGGGSVPHSLEGMGFQLGLVIL